MIKPSITFLIIAAIFLAGCAKKPILYTSDEIMEEFSPTIFEFEYISAKGRIVLEEANGKVTKGTISLRAKKDSVVWFSITPGLGVEAIRGMVTEEKMRIKDRINGEDINISFVEMFDRYGLKLDLPLMQNLIFANVPQEFSYRDRLLRAGKYFELTQIRDGVRYHSRVSTTHGKVVELTSNTLDDKGSFMASYPTFEEVNGQPFPNKMLLKLSFNSPEGVQNAIIHLEFSRIDYLNEAVSFPFHF
ncbi:DUF4292 domain-containing protein [Cognataquiflexum rubidum]|uniref:DUF4292 domain-containing protein n=1 Tax=Cognataquiflexum rubidum TaxID=2922273 RepID=UPI001F13C2D0|nr:DUF4292 domain-containing protein [Cognataquiflexum rubidum]MCH6233184.1 DUF4292 domain-containing protein [Cognataquiflexum rubidum]